MRIQQKSNGEKLQGLSRNAAPGKIPRCAGHPSLNELPHCVSNALPLQPDRNRQARASTAGKPSKMHPTQSQLPPVASRTRLVALFALLIAFALADAFAPRTVVLLSFYWIPVVFAVTFATARQVAALAATTLVLGIAAGFHKGHGHYASIDYPVSLIALTIVSAISVVVAMRREHAEQTRATAAERLNSEQKVLATVLEHVDANIYMKDRQGRFLYANPRSLATLGRPLSDVVGRTNAELFPPEVARELTRTDEEVFESDESVQCEETITMHDGSTRIFLSEKVRLRIEGEPDRLIGFSADITALKNAESEHHELVEQVNEKLVAAQMQLVQDKLKLRATLDCLLDPHVIMQPVRDEGGRITDFVITDANPAACSYEGIPRDKLVGKRILELFPASGDSVRLDLLRRLMETGEPLVLNEHVYPDEISNESRHYDIRAVRVDGSVSYTWRDVTDRYTTAREMERRARFDSLTNLLNRHEALHQMEAAINRRSGHEMAVLFCDLDRFKDINDAHGHQAGDEVLKAMADRLRSMLRSTDDIAARFGGDELLVVLHGVQDMQNALDIAEKLRLQASEPIAVDGGDIRTTMSIGVALSTPGESVDSIIARADEAMYRAKLSGRDQVVPITGADLDRAT